MANKKTKETVFRDKEGQRWRFLEVGTGGWTGRWLMAKIKDGHRLYLKIEDLTVE